MADQKKDILKDAFAQLMGELQTILTISYVFAVGIGMLFTFKKFEAFGINIFDYADVFDFLIAPFSDYRILVFTLFSVGVTLFVFVLDIWFRNKFPKIYSKSVLGLDKKSWYKYFWTCCYLIIFIMYLYRSAQMYADTVMDQILHEPVIQIRFSDGEIKTGQKIGKTKEVIFLNTSTSIEVVPITSLVKEIKVKTNEP